MKPKSKRTKKIVRNLLILIFVFFAGRGIFYSSENILNYRIRIQILKEDPNRCESSSGTMPRPMNSWFHLLEIRRDYPKVRKLMLQHGAKLLNTCPDGNTRNILTRELNRIPDYLKYGTDAHEAVLNAILNYFIAYYANYMKEENLTKENLAKYLGNRRTLLEQCKSVLPKLSQEERLQIRQAADNADNDDLKKLLSEFGLY